jgi:nitronate monooxygenase
LGSPKEVIDKCKPADIKVFCDVVDLKFALKVAELGADAVIAVNSSAGGHAGNMTAEELVPLLKRKLDIPIISAGGIATNDQLKKALDIGADAASIGTLFIASKEASVSEEYKNALVQYSAKDIVMTSNISGTPITVINTPYMKKYGNKQGTMSRILSRNKRFKKYIKMFIMVKGMKSIRRAANKPTYKTVWVAGYSIEDIHSIRPVKEIIKSLFNK